LFSIRSDHTLTDNAPKSKVYILRRINYLFNALAAKNKSLPIGKLNIFIVKVEVIEALVDGKVYSIAT
jgi:hypothetical protein